MPALPAKEQVPTKDVMWCLHILKTFYLSIVMFLEDALIAYVSSCISFDPIFSIFKISIAVLAAKDVSIIFQNTITSKVTVEPSDVVVFRYSVGSFVVLVSLLSDPSSSLYT